MEWTNLLTLGQLKKKLITNFRQISLGLLPKEIEIGLPHG